jgi:hypothetical protein
VAGGELLEALREVVVCWSVAVHGRRRGACDEEEEKGGGGPAT